MIGSIQKKGRIYYAVFSKGRDPTTQRWGTKWVPIGPDRSEAERLLPKIRANYEAGRYQENEKMTVKQYLEMWQELFSAKLRRATLESYVWAIEKHICPAVGDIRLQKLSPLHIQRMLANLSSTKLSATSVRYIYNVLNITLNQAVKLQIIELNPCRAVDPPRKEKYHAAVYNSEELQALINAAQGSSLLIPILLAAGCGMRRGEVCGLRWRDVDLDQKLLHIRYSLDRPEQGKLALLPVKTDNSERTVRIPEFLEQPLVAVRQQRAVTQAGTDSAAAAPDDTDDKDYVYSWEDGSAVDPDYLDKSFRVLLAGHNLKTIRFHDLRHTHATLLLQEHVPVKVISERLGHSSIKITQDIYSHVLPEMQQEAVNAIDRVLDQAVEAEQKRQALAPNVINFSERLAQRKKASNN